MSYLRILLAALAIAVAPHSSIAGDSNASATPSANDVRRGDRWTYDSVDEITNEPSGQFVFLVTDKADNEISVRLTKSGDEGRYSFITYDTGWNLKTDGFYQWSPNDGDGAHLPLSVGKQWTLESTARDLKTGTSFKRTRVDRVTGAEHLTLPTDSYDTFKVESAIVDQASNGSRAIIATSITTWWAPSINHWVKRLVETRNGKKLLASSSMVLSSYKRRND